MAQSVACRFQTVARQPQVVGVSMAQGVRAYLLCSPRLSAIRLIHLWAVWLDIFGSCKGSVTVGVWSGLMVSAFTMLSPCQFVAYHVQYRQ